MGAFCFPGQATQKAGHRTGGMKESEIMKAIMIEASRLGARLFRNNVGVLRDNRGNYIRYGLCPGSSDLVGWTPEGRFLAVEIKRPGKYPTPMQEAFLQAISQSGGRAFVAHSLDEFNKEFSRCQPTN